MKDLDLNACKLFGEALRYPAPGLNTRLADGVAAVKDPDARKALSQFAAVTKKYRSVSGKTLYLDL